MEIKREEYLQKLISKIDNKMIKVITGIRRCGKSYLLFNLFKNYLLSQTDSLHIIEIVLDNDEFIALRNPILLGEFLRKKIIDSKKYYVLIDEIQFCKKVENPNLKGDFISFYEVLNGLLQRNNVDVFVTGSNSKMLSKDILTEFRGRGDQIHIYPLTFKEIYNPDKNFEEEYNLFSTYGGLPKIYSLFSDVEKSEYLKNLIDEVYLKDIVQRNNIQSESELKDLSCVLASNIGSYTNSTKIENTFASNKIVYSNKTISNHIECLIDAFLISVAKRFDIKGRKHIGANQKYYFTDIGLRNALLNFRQQEPSHIMENIIYNELLQREYNVDVGMVETSCKNQQKYVKKQLEVDFVCNKGSEKLYIQSAYEIWNDEKAKQEKALLKKIDDSFKKVIIVKNNIKSWVDENGFLFIGLKEFLIHGV